MIEELRPGLKRWTTPHPEWKPEEDELDESYRPVASVLYRAPEALVFVDPLVPDELWPTVDDEVAAAALPVVVLTTIHWHARSRDAVVERYGAELDRIPHGIRSFPAERQQEVVLWLGEPCALLFGDAVLGDQRGGLRVSPWFESDADRGRTVAALRPLLDLPVELVLPAHGNAVLEHARDALERALAAQP
jgi:glyoxylase-like metal-dependent hydrolase (beta-lactamase superfamily II)